MNECKFEWLDEKTRGLAIRLLYRLKDSPELLPAEVFLLGQITGVLSQPAPPKPPSVSRETVDRIISEIGDDSFSCKISRETIIALLAAEGITVEEKKV